MTRNNTHSLPSEEFAPLEFDTPKELAEWLMQWPDTTYLEGKDGDVLRVWMRCTTLSDGSKVQDLIFS